MKTFFKFYLPAIIWMLVIFGFSTIPGGESHSETANQVFTRKGAHFVEFSILAFLFWRIFYLAHKLSLKKAYFFALIIAVFYGASDEFHQTFVFGRTGKAMDAFFDAISVVFSLELIIVYTRKKISWKNFAILFFSFLALAGLEVKMIQDGNKNVRDVQNVVNVLDDENDKKVENVGNAENVQNVKVVENAQDVADDKNAENAASVVDVQNVVSESAENFEIIEEPEKIADKILIPVPFTSQAPFKVWDEIHEEACEEASIIMLKYFFDEKKLTPEIAEREIQNLVAFQNKNFGDFKDTNVQETADLFLQYYGELSKGKKLKVVYNFEKEDLKKKLALGFPIIVPAAGRELGNPNFTPPGPLYHNLVLVGYDGDIIITNDPGTRKGEGYQYNMNILYNAIHDFTGDPKDIKKGRKAMIVVE